MSTYFIGDIHGCYKYLEIILNHIQFDPKKDTLHCTGDLVSKGPNSLEVLRLMYQLKSSATTVLGNHDLHLLKIYFFGTNQKKILDYFHSILHAPDINELMHWLRHQSILYINKKKKILMTHAGIHPHWNLQKLKKNAKEIEKILTSNNFNKIFKHITYKKNKPYIHFNKLKKIQKNIDIFTTMRYIHANGQLNIKYKDIPKNTPKEANILPWFKVPGLINREEYNIIFGHWSALRNTKDIPPGIYGLDSGCCWGGKLTILCWENKKITQIPCN